MQRARALTEAPTHSTHTSPSEDSTHTQTHSTAFSSSPLKCFRAPQHVDADRHTCGGPLINDENKQQERKGALSL